MKEYRIADLAREAGVSVRNVRVYQDRGLLPPPRKEGRAGWYNDAHLARLALIGRMLDRGYTFATISELLTAARYGLHVRDVLETDGPVTAVRVEEIVQVLAGAGIPAEDIREQADAARRDLEAVATRFVDLVAARYLAPDGGILEFDEAAVSEAATLVDKVRPLAHEAVHAMFAEAMENQISKALAKAASQLEHVAAETGSARTG